MQPFCDWEADVYRDRMNRLGAGSAAAANTTSDRGESSSGRTAAVSFRNEQHNSSSGTVEALQQRMLLHLNKAS